LTLKLFLNEIGNKGIGFCQKIKICLRHNQTPTRV
jgi:hypothetical protein